MTVAPSAVMHRHQLRKRLARPRGELEIERLQRRRCVAAAGAAIEPVTVDTESMVRLSSWSLEGGARRASSPPRSGRIHAAPSPTTRPPTHDRLLDQVYRGQAPALVRLRMQLSGAARRG